MDAKTKGQKLDYVYLHSPIFVPEHGSFADSLQAKPNNAKAGLELYLYDGYVYLFLENKKGQKDTVLIPTAQLKHVVLAK